jgi:hypothetical protein
MADQRQTHRDVAARRSVRIVHLFPLVPLFIVAVLASQQVRDNSLLWHIRAGAVQVADGLVLVADPFSIARIGSEWRTQSWLLELLYAYLDGDGSSLAWVSVFVFVVGGMTAAVIGVSIYRSTPSPITLSAAMIGMIWLAGPFLQPRPVIVSYLLLALLVVVLQNRDSAMWLIVPIVWIWAAVHGSWVIGGGLIVLELIRMPDRRLFKAGVVALMATFLTAHGLGVWEILVDFAGAQGALALIDEWQTPDFADLMQAPYLLLIVGIIVASMRGKLTARDLIVILPFLFFGMTSRRAVFPAAIVLAPWAAMALLPVKVPRSRMSPAVVGVAMALVGLLVLTPLMFRPLGKLDYERFPSPEIQAAMQGRSVFHDDVVGGFLIYDEWPGRLTLIDDRAELYGEEFFLQFTQVRDGQYEELFEEYGFDAALTKEGWGLNERLRADGWIPVVESDSMVLFYSPEM